MAQFGDIPICTYGAAHKHRPERDAAERAVLDAAMAHYRTTEHMEPELKRACARLAALGEE